MERLALYIGGGLFLTISAGAAALSTSQNVMHGLVIGVPVAAAFLLAEVGRISIPIVAGLRGGFTKKMWLVLITCGLTSVTAAISNYADQKVAYLLAAERNNAKVERAQAAYNRLVAELASITVVEAPQDLQALITTYTEKASKEAARGFCGPKCSAAEKSAAETQVKLAQANRKIALKGEIIAAQAVLDNSRKVEASGLAQIIAKFSGLNVEKVAMVESLFNGILFILLIEQLVYLIIPGISFIRQAVTGEKEIEPVVAPVAVVLPMAREEETLQRVVAMLLRSEDGSICCSGRELARRLNVPNSTFSPWLARWIKEGKIKSTDVTAHKKRFAA